MQNCKQINENKPLPRAVLRTLALLLGLAPAVALADHTTLSNNDGISYQFDPSESTVQTITFPALNGPCDECNGLFVDGNPFDGGGSQSTLSGLERTADVEVISGLAVSRRTYVSPDNNFVRQVNVFQNNTAADITISFNYDNDYNTNTTVVATSSGDALPDDTDRWITTSHTAGYALLAQSWGNAGAADTIDAITDPAGASTAQTWSWTNVTVPAGQTYIYVTFLAAEADATAAQTKAEALEAISLGDMFVGLESDLSRVRNWVFPDSDSDGILDFTETANGLDPNDPADAAADADSDGLTNLEEVQAGTGINEADTDADGLEDGAEVNTHGTNPLLADSDVDGIDDGGELAVGLDPVANEFLTTEEFVVTDGTQDADQPDFAVDANGNVHLVWSENDGADYEIRYAMLSATGVVLVAPTPLTDNPIRDRMPHIRAGAAGRMFVTWHTDGQEVLLLRLDPATDDQNGDAANPATLIDVPAVTISPNGRHSHLAVDTAGNVHIAWQDSNDDSRHYAKYDADLVNLVADTPIAGDGGDFEDYLGLALDSAGNVHLSWTNENNAVVYAMLDGSDGSVLIAPTVVGGTDGSKSKHASLTVDAADHVNIVWMDRVGDTAEIYFTQLDPAAAAQDGSAAVLNDVVQVAEKQISPNNNLESLYPHSTLEADGSLLVTWTYELTAIDENGSRTGPVWLARFDGQGNPAGGPFKLYAADDSSSSSNLNYFRAGDGFAAWSEPAAAPATGRQIVLATAAFAPPGDGPSGTIGISVSAGALAAAQTLSLSDLPGSAAADAPAGLTLPDGLARFAVTGLSPGQTIVATLTFPNEVPDTAAYFKWDMNNGWYEIPFTPGDTANQIKLILTDGGAGDADGRVNGQIVDPGGYGTGIGFGPQVTADGTGGGGCTLNPGAPFDPVLLLLLATALIYLWRRRSAGKGV